MAFKQIPVSASAISGSHTDFPVYIKPSAMTGWEALTLAEAQSIRFYSDEAKTTELAREVVSADEIHVKASSLTTSTTIYADYDGVRADYAVGATYGRNAVWGDYYAVSHNGGFDVDSTGNGRTFTASGGITQGGVSGRLGSGTYFDGSDDLLESTDVTLREFWKTHNFTFSAWIKPDRLTTNDIFVSSGTIGDSSNIFAIYPNDSNAAVGGLRAFWRATSPSNWIDEAGADLKDMWQLLYISSTSTTSHSARRNGAFVGNNTSTATSQTYSFTRLGNWTGPRWFQGTSAEVRFSKTPLSADWHDTEYNNQNDVASFWGTVTDVGPAPAPVADTGFFAFV